MVVQPSLCQTRWETTKTDFHMPHFILGEPGMIYGTTSLSEIHFGSGGSSATASYGAGNN